MKTRSQRRLNNPLSAVFVETERVKQAFARIDELVDEGWEDDNCRALLLLGHSRAGKTHIVNNYIRLRVTEQPDCDERLRILKVEVQAGCKLKTFATDLLIALGDPDPSCGSQAEMTRRIAEAIERDHYDLMIFDEVQRLIDADTDKVKRDVANWVTGLLNRRLCPLLLVGERKAERVFESNMHVKGRTFGEVVLDPYDWSSDADRKEFRVILHLLEKKLELTEASGLGQAKTSIRIYAYSGGLLGEAATLVAKAVLVARRMGRPCLNDEVLALAVDELRVGEDRKLPNPFRTEVIDPRPVTAEPEVHVPRRGRGKRAAAARAEEE